MHDDGHVSSVFFEAPFDQVWEWLSEPLSFPRIYPHWTASAAEAEDGYECVGPGGEQFRIVPSTDRESGILDFEVIDPEGHVEHSRGRLMSMKAGGCALVHLAVRWDGLDDKDWERHRRDTDADFAQAKRVIEQEASD